MDIRGWPIDRVMQLPDCCFGPRFVVSVSGAQDGVGDTFGISDIAFPSQCVIWEYSIYFGDIHGDGEYYRLALAMDVPETVAEFSNLEPLFHGWGLPGIGPGQLWQGYGQNFAMRRLKILKDMQSRRLVLQCHGVALATVDVFAAVVVTSLPNDIPDVKEIVYEY